MCEGQKRTQHFRLDECVHDIVVVVGMVNVMCVTLYVFMYRGRQAEGRGSWGVMGVEGLESAGCT